MTPGFFVAGVGTGCHRVALYPQGNKKGGDFSVRMLLKMFGICLCGVATHTSRMLIVSAVKRSKPMERGPHRFSGVLGQSTAVSSVLVRLRRTFEASDSRRG